MKLKYLVICMLFILASCSSSSDDDLLPVAENEMMVMDDDSMDEMETNAYAGDFVSSAHTTTGKAYVNSDKTILSFSNFKTDNGPLLEVYVATDLNPSSYISLGKLKGISGDFDYSLPSNVDFSTHKYVIIWCVDFSVNFGYAILE